MSVSLKVSNYKVGRTLGQGAYGKVKLAVNETLDEAVAFKVLNKHKIRKLGMQEKVKREVKAMKKLQHPHIISLYQVIDTHSDIFLALELATGGDLYDRVCTSGKLSEVESRRLFRQLAAALSFCHSKGVAHRDLKLENLLLDRDQNLKIADFGLCNMMQDGASLQTSCGSPDYAAPEILEHQPYDGTKVDSWSAGVILYTMLYGQLPFDGENRSRMFQKVIEGEYRFLDDVVEISESAKDLIRRLLDPNPVTRLSMHEAQSHAWLYDSAASASTSSSYLANYSNFLVTQGIDLKPKSASQIDKNLLGQLIEMRQRFPLLNVQAPFDQLIATYLRKSHRSSCKKELGSKDAFSVLNLCVAYKFLLHAKLVSRCFESELERSQLQHSVVNAHPEQHDVSMLFAEQMVDLGHFAAHNGQQLITAKQACRLAHLKQKFAAPRAAHMTAAQPAETTSKCKLLLSVDSRDAEKPASVQTAFEVVCDALRSIGYSWRFAMSEKDPCQVDGRVMVARTRDSAASFLIFFYTAVAQETEGQRALYAIDFGVKKQQEQAHLVYFDAISAAYEAILLAVRAKSAIVEDPYPQLILVESVQEFLASKKTPSDSGYAATETDSRNEEQNIESSQSKLSLGEGDHRTIEQNKGDKIGANNSSHRVASMETKETLTDQPASFEAQYRLL